MSALVVRRRADTAARYRKMDVLVDGRMVGRLKRKQELSLDLPVGPHVVRGRMDWTTSRAVALEVGAEPSRVMLGYSATAVFRMLLQPNTAIDIELEVGTLSDQQVPVVDRERYWPKATIAGVAFLTLWWLSQTTIVPFGVNVVASIALIGTALYLVTQVLRLANKYRQKRPFARPRDQ